MVRSQHSLERLTFWLSGVLLYQHLQNVLEFGPRIVLRKVLLLFPLIIITAWLDSLHLASSVFAPAGDQSNQNNSIFSFCILPKIYFGLIKL